MKNFEIGYVNAQGIVIAKMVVEAETLNAAKIKYLEDYLKLDKTHWIVRQSLVGKVIKESKKQEVKEMAKNAKKSEVITKKANAKESKNKEVKAMTKNTKNAEVITVSMALNEEHKGVELKFSGKPDVKVREALKNAGFRWHNTRQIWYAKQTAKAMELAKAMAEPKAEPKPKKSAKPKAEPKAKKAEPKANSIVSENKERGGVEIRFTEKPSDEVRKALKDAGFHWNPKTEVWYAKATKETMKKAKEIAKAV